MTKAIRPTSYAGGTNLPRRLFRQRLKPDIAIADLAAVVLQEDAAGLAELFIKVTAGDLVEVAVGHFLTVLDDGHVAFFLHFSGIIDARGAESDVVSLPLLRRLAGV